MFMWSFGPLYASGASLQGACDFQQQTSVLTGQHGSCQDGFKQKEGLEEGTAPEVNHKVDKRHPKVGATPTPNQFRAVGGFLETPLFSMVGFWGLLAALELAGLPNPRKALSPPALATKQGSCTSPIASVKSGIIYIYAYIDISIYVYVYVYTRTCIQTYIYIYVHTQICIYICIYIYTYIYICACIHVYMYVLLICLRPCLFLHVCTH